MKGKAAIGTTVGTPNTADSIIRFRRRLSALFRVANPFCSILPELYRLTILEALRLSQTGGMVTHCD